MMNIGLIKSFDNTTNQSSFEKSPKFLGQRMRERICKTLGFDSNATLEKYSQKEIVLFVGRVLVLSLTCA